MSLKSILRSIVGSAPAAAIVVTASTALTQAVATAAQAGNPIGAMAIKTATALESTSMTGAEKKKVVVAAIVPLVMESAGKGGMAAIAADAEAFAGLVVEEVVAAIKATPLAQLAMALLKALVG